MELKWDQDEYIISFPTKQNNPESYAGFSCNPKETCWLQNSEPKNAWNIVHILENIIR
jgi:hypothetical protein